MVVMQITPNVRLRWGGGSLPVRLATGVALGAGLSLVLLGLVSAAAGHLSPDPRIVLLMSEGDPTHIVLMVLITCIAAPLVEETLFRGLLLEALRPRGRGLAIVGSALAFAIWHFIPSALIYYGVLGAGLAAIYLWRGLAASMAAHAGFNGVLTVAAIVVVLGPAHPVAFGGVSFTAPPHPASRRRRCRCAARRTRSSTPSRSPMRSRAQRMRSRRGSRPTMVGCRTHWGP
jgi:membrane protease YdiL (CAAX protease family)